MRDINYCCSCSFYTATLYIELGPIFPCMLAQLAFARALEGVNNQTTKTIWLVARIEVYWQNVV